MNVVGNNDFNAVFGETVKKDPYKMRELAYSGKNVDYFIDIGANIGVVSLFAKFLFPRAKIIALEPGPKTFNALKNNFSNGDKNVFIENMAYGNGEELVFYDVDSSGSNFTMEDCKNCFNGKYPDVKVKSVDLKSIFKKHSIPLKSDYIIKFDCEGCEKNLIKEEGIDEILKNSVLSIIEVHFSHNNVGGRNYELYKHLPSWEIYRDWMNRVFKKTHNIVYGNSRSSRGYGVFTALKL